MGQKTVSLVEFGKGSGGACLLTKNQGVAFKVISMKDHKQKGEKIGVLLYTKRAIVKQRQVPERRWDLNPRHVEYDSTVLTTKLPRQHNHQLVTVASITIYTSFAILISGVNSLKQF